MIMMAVIAGPGIEVPVIKLSTLYTSSHLIFSILVQEKDIIHFAFQVSLSDGCEVIQSKSQLEDSGALGGGKDSRKKYS